MTEPREVDEQAGRDDERDRRDDDRDDERDSTEDGGLLPDADAGPTAAEKYSVDEEDHGRQDYGP